MKKIFYLATLVLITSSLSFAHHDEESHYVYLQDPSELINPNGFFEYQIVPSDHLSHIAYKFYFDGNKWVKIYKANPYVIDPNWIYPDNWLVIPDIYTDADGNPVTTSTTFSYESDESLINNKSNYKSKYVGIDTDNDGYINGYDIDGDGIIDTNTNLTASEITDYKIDLDGDGEFDGVDINGDGKIDLSANIDLDGDGIVDGYDIDGDGIIDVKVGNVKAFSQIDLDGDGEFDGVDINGDGKIDLSANIDLDGDGIVDGYDIDGDGIIDILADRTIATSTVVKTEELTDAYAETVDGYQIDVDGDSIPDGVDIDGDGYIDYEAGIDSDQDGVIDGYDIDGDGIIDILTATTDDVLASKSNNKILDDEKPVHIDLDGDGISDGIDIDGDGLIDYKASIDYNNDGIVDGYDLDGDGKIDIIASEISNKNNIKSINDSDDINRIESISKSDKSEKRSDKRVYSNPSWVFGLYGGYPFGDVPDEDDNLNYGLLIGTPLRVKLGALSARLGGGILGFNTTDKIYPGAGLLLNLAINELLGFDIPIQLQVHGTGFYVPDGGLGTGVFGSTSVPLGKSPFSLGLYIGLGSYDNGETQSDWKNTGLMLQLQL